MVSKEKDIPKLKKLLPIDVNDLKIINAFPNKMDILEGSSINFRSTSRNHFYDIELDFIEFSPDSLLTIQLNKGQYEIIQTESTATVKIYDSKSRLLYIETHRCDENW